MLVRDSQPDANEYAKHWKREQQPSILLVNHRDELLRRVLVVTDCSRGSRLEPFNGLMSFDYGAVVSPAECTGNRDKLGCGLFYLRSVYCQRISGFWNCCPEKLLPQTLVVSLATDSGLNSLAMSADTCRSR